MEFMKSRDVLLYLTIKYQGEWNKIYQALQEKEDVEPQEVLKVRNEFKGNFITITDEDYPKCFREDTYQPPFVLFYEGNLDLLKSKKIIAIGCSREISPLDERNAEIILNNQEDITYLIGGSLSGIDQYVMSLGKPTIAVLGQPLDDMRSEPFKSCDLVLSEYPSGSDLTQQKLIARNRIIASLATRLLVLKAKKMSGAMILVNIALQKNKDILVVPQPLEDKNSINNELIGEGAYICISPQDLVRCW